MVNFLIRRPIAVIMSFIAILMLGLVTSQKLPISLIPDVDIPVITIQLNGKNKTALELENEVVRRFRSRLNQLPYLESLQSETRDGIASIVLRFSYGRDLNYAFIDVNEKVDMVMRNMPKDFERPAIMKASSTDLPAFYLNASLKKNVESKTDHLDLSETVSNVIRKKIEQLPEVAMVDMTGRMFPEISITPDAQKMKSLGLRTEQLTRVINEHNRGFGSIQVKDGQYQYNIHLSNGLHQLEDVKSIYLNVNQHLLQLKDIATVEMRAQSRSGLFMTNGEEGISMAIVKQADARMEDMSNKVNGLLRRITKDYPFIEITKVRDQTGILKYAMSNLFQSLWWGGLLAFLVMFLFLKDGRSPWLIGVSVPISLVISLLLFYLLDISINIISLSGLILGVGMMIDNSIIVIDNITQRISMGDDLMEACANGTHEVIRPLISSVLTTCAVFLPLIYLSGISGALFYDQAMAVTIGLSSSLVVSIILIPTLYRLIWIRGRKRQQEKKNRFAIFSSSDAYEKGWHWVFNHRKGMFAAFLMLIGFACLFVYILPKERFPVLDENEVLVKLDWNERINLRENRHRVVDLLDDVKPYIEHSDSYVGTQQFLHHNDLELAENESVIYLKLRQSIDKSDFEDKIHNYFTTRYPIAHYDISVPPSGFTQMFEGKEAPFILNLEQKRQKQQVGVDSLNHFVEYLNHQYPFGLITPFASETYVEICVIPEHLTLYRVGQVALFNKLKTALKSFKIEDLRSSSVYIPIVISGKMHSMEQVLRELKIRNQKNVDIPVSSLVTLKQKTNFKTYFGNRKGQVFPINFESTGGYDQTELEQLLKREVREKQDMNSSFGGSIIKAKAVLKELLIVLLIALCLLYFILAAQFESLTQPFIVLLEVPMDIAGALFILWVGGETLNLMAMIGIIVMCGIIINDSILKIDTINQLRKQGRGLKEAIEEGGHRRLKPILMTSITTILALVPFLIGDDMGSVLQRPLALVIIGGMTLGTFVSLYFVPLCYYYLNRKSND
ncbi:efflux RND transporter permease subunit [Halosquirtibacter xylanolyticus]|uniref:efflux RND transporter permease subunit n=1 Tax=Halosquirtibacter xylanolyticus TaxID=3374599 RepID=UPI003749066A|nr:efflux RND transporter permease subunit [Prolixibacteraceae bacterium]